MINKNTTESILLQNRRTLEKNNLITLETEFAFLEKVNLVIWQNC